MSKKTAAPVPSVEKESRRERFVRLAEARTNKIINMIQLLGNCSNRSAYEYTEADVEEIFGAIEAELADAKKKFLKTEGEKNRRFTLKF